MNLEVYWIENKTSRLTTSRETTKGKGYSLGKNGANHRTVLFMACMRYLQNACLLSSQKTPIALHLIFSLLFNYSPPTNVVVSPFTLPNWNILLGEADKLIFCKNLRVAHMISHCRVFQLWCARKILFKVVVKREHFAHNYTSEQSPPYQLLF